MKKICNTEFGGERPLYCEKDLRLENVTIHLGESSLKETSNIEAEGCRFEGKYVFWETKGFRVNNCFLPFLQDLLYGIQKMPDSQTAWSKLLKCSAAQKASISKM